MSTNWSRLARISVSNNVHGSRCTAAPITETTISIYIRARLFELTRELVLNDRIGLKINRIRASARMFVVRVIWRSWSWLEHSVGRRILNSLYVGFRCVGLPLDVRAECQLWKKKHTVATCMYTARYVPTKYRTFLLRSILMLLWASVSVHATTFICWFVYANVLRDKFALTASTQPQHTLRRN